MPLHLAGGLAEDVRHAARALADTRLVSAIAVGTLALAIGANAAVFSLINALLIRDLAVTKPEQLVTVSSDVAIAQGFTAGAGWNYPMWENLRQRSTLFGGALAWFPQRLTHQVGGEAIPLDVLFVSGEYFSTLGVPAVHGRVFVSNDDQYGGGPAGTVGVISYRYWQNAFAGDPGIVGTSMEIERVPITIIGVAPKTFAGLEMGRGFDVALPMGVEPIVRGKATTLRGSRSYLVLVMLRLREGQTIGSATNELRRVQSEIIPAGAPPFVRHPFALVPAARGAANPGAPQRVYERPLVIMLAGVALVLVMACVNVANLLLTRVTARRRELAVRVAVGASRWRLLRPLFLEGLLLAIAGTVGGAILASLAAQALVALTDASISPGVDWRVATFTATAAITTGLLVSVAPALRAIRVAPAEALKAGGRGNCADRSARLSQGLLVFQIAVAVIVVTASALLVRTFMTLSARPLGFAADRVVLVSIETSRVEAADARRLQLFQQLADRVAGVAGVERAARSIWTPLTSGGIVVGMRAPDASPDATPVNVVVNFVTPGWFGTYAIPFRLGRDFSTTDTIGATPVVIVNEAFVRDVLRGRAGLGAVVGDHQTVLGIVADAVSRSTQRVAGVSSVAVREAPPPTVYVPLAQASLWDRPPTTAISIAVRPSGADAMTLVPAIRRELAAVDPDLSFTFRPLMDDVDRALAQERVMAILSAAFGGMSLMLGAIGLYGVMAYTVSLRRSELGIRLALGAQRSGLMRLILGRTLAIVGLGTVIGLLAAVVLLRPVSGMLFGVTLGDPLTLGAVAVVLALVAVLATLGPASKASRVDPLSVLRSS